MSAYTTKAQNLLLCKPAAVWDILAGRRVLVAFSGGKDSLALLAYMLEYQADKEWQLAACHVNHQLRADEADRDEQFCREWCRKNNIEYFSKKEKVSDKGRGTESAARDVRYKLLDECAGEWGADYVVTAHTASDQLESFFVDLMTGTSVFTIGGITGQNGIYIRPMLDVSTDMVNEYLALRAEAPVYDSSNSDLRYVRNFVRERIIPLIADNAQFKASVSRVQEESRLLNAYFADITKDFAYCPAEGGVVIRRALLDKSDEMLQRYILGKWISALARGGTVHINAVLKQLQNSRSARLDLPQNFYCEITPRHVRIFHKSMVDAFCIRADSYSGDKALPESLKTDKVILRSRKNGDKYKGKKIKDLFERLKLDLYERDRAIIAEIDGQIVWVEYVDI